MLLIDLLRYVLYGFFDATSRSTAYTIIIIIYSSQTLTRKARRGFHESLILVAIEEKS